ncbi:MAG: hypothetical protein LBH05_00490, partial [Deferribacteraceae bacterium]|nr:hypothetical protein [Deferribacteraceae bacterium]
MKKVLLVILLTIGMLDITYADGRGVTSREHPWVMRSVAALGMGDAYYAKSDSKYAPFYNPAGLARVKNSRVDIFPLSVGVGTNFLDFYKDYNNTDTGSNSDIADLISGQIGKL